MENNDPKPAVAAIRKSLKIYPYTPGGFGTSIADDLEGKSEAGSQSRPYRRRSSSRRTGKSFNTIPPNDFTYFEMVDKLVQMEPATSFNAELLGQFTAIGIVKGKPFKPDARMKKILTDAAAVGNAAGAHAELACAEYPGWAYYPGSMWANMLWQGGFNFETPPPMITKEGFKPFPPTGARTLDSRTAFYYAYTMDSPGMIMRMPHVGSQYLMGFVDAAKNPLRWRKDVQGDPAEGNPRGQVLVVHAVRQPDPLHAPDAAALSARGKPDRIRRRPRWRMPTARRRFTSAQPSPPTQRKATGFRPCPARAGSRSCVSTARWNRSSTRAGARAKST